MSFLFLFFTLIPFPSRFHPFPQTLKLLKPTRNRSIRILVMLTSYHLEWVIVLKLLLGNVFSL